MTSRLKFKTSKFELEWESNETITTDVIVSLIDMLSEIKFDDQLEVKNNSTSTRDAKLEDSTGTFTTELAANRLGINTGPELFKVALAKLQISDGLKFASRKQITDEMKTATGIWNETILKNLSQTIKSLSGPKKKLLNEPKANHYSLTESAIKEFHGQFFG